MNKTTETEGLGQLGLFTEEQEEKLLMNGASTDRDPIPVVYLVHNKLNYQWLITEIYEHKPDMAYGLICKEFGDTKVGYIDLNEISDLNTDKRNDKVINSRNFTPVGKLSVYAAVAKELGYIEIRQEGNSAIFEKYKNTTP